MKKILVLTTSLGQGGITSFLIPLTNYLASCGHDVTLAYTKDEGEFLDRFKSSVKFLQYATPSRNQTIKAWIKNLSFYDMARISFRRSKSKPHYASVQRLNYITARNTKFTTEYFDIAISTAESYCNAMVAWKVNADKKIGWVHPDMGSIGLDTSAGGKVLEKLDKVVAVSESGCESLKKFFPDKTDKFIHIENMMDCENIIKRGNETIHDMPVQPGYRCLVTVCRIANESKRLDRAVNVARILKGSGYKFCWYIIGDGPDKRYIETLVNKHDVGDCMFLIGGRSNPLPYINKADYFVLTSQFEGKPVVIEEAKILHTPVLVTEYSSAPTQVDKNVGIVVPNNDTNSSSQLATFIMDESTLLRLKENILTFEYSNEESKKNIIDLIR